jgi:hypothetical protein
LRVENLQELYRFADLQERFLLQVLLNEDIPITEIITKLEPIGGYHFTKSLNLHPKTIEAAEDWLTSEKWLKSRKNADGKAFTFTNYRSIDERISNLEDEMRKNNSNIDYPLYAKNIQEFGNMVHSEDLIRWLDDALKTEVCPKCGQKV